MSHVLPYWDNAPQQQSPPCSHIYMEEEAQELVEKAYQEGWQQGMEEGYRLGKDKGYKEYKEQEEEQETKKAKKQANEAMDAYQNTQNTPRTIIRVNATTQMDSAAPKAFTSAKTMHTTTTSPKLIGTSTKHLELFTAAPRSPTLSISPVYSSPKAQTVKISDYALYLIKYHPECIFTH